MKSFHNVAFALSVLIVPGFAAADNCGPDCGRVTAIHQGNQEGSGIGLGTVIGGVAGGLLGNQVGGGKGKTLATIGGAAGGAYAGHEFEKRRKDPAASKVTVQMDNGDTRTFDYHADHALSVGDRVRVNNGTLERYSGR